MSDEFIGDINDICLYLEPPVCCHPELEAGEVSEEYCLQCKFRSIPLKEKAITMLRDLTMVASTAGYYLEQDKNDPVEIKKFLLELAIMVKDCDRFLDAVGVKLSEDKNG